MKKTITLLNMAHDLYKAWLKANNILYKRSANELLEDNKAGKFTLTSSQAIFLSCYIVLWHELERT